MRIYILVMAIASLMFYSCGATKTMAEKCADCIEMFPPKKVVDIDTFWEVHNFRVEEFVYIYEDTIECPEISIGIEIDKSKESLRNNIDTVTRVPIRREVKVPIIKEPDSSMIITIKERVIDSSVLARNRELEFELEKCSELLKVAQKRNRGKISGKMFAIVMILMASAIVTLILKK